jgi:hypothetical protein
MYTTIQDRVKQLYDFKYKYMLYVYRYVFSTLYEANAYSVIMNSERVNRKRFRRHELLRLLHVQHKSQRCLETL